MCSVNPFVTSVYVDTYMINCKNIKGVFVGKIFCLLCIALVSGLPLWGEDQGFSEKNNNWPCYKGNHFRTSYTASGLSASLKMSWSYEFLERPQMAWPGIDSRNSFDAAFEPIIAENKVYFGNSNDNAVYGMDINNGEIIWQFFTQGPIRYAPAYWQGALYVVSDDGCLYCLKATDGTLLWKYRGGPTQGMIFGNGRLISRWPARGGPVIEKDVVYFACGIWPTDGITIHALNAQSGQVKWCNDMSGSLYMTQPHKGSEAKSGLSAQGYLTLLGDRLLLPTGRAIPAILDKKTGKFVDFQLSQNRKRGGGNLAVVEDLNLFISNGTCFELPGKEIRHIKLPNSYVLAPENKMIYFENQTLLRGRMGKKDAVDRKGKKNKVFHLFDVEKFLSVDEKPTSLALAGTHVIIGLNNKVIVYDLKKKKKEMEHKVKGRVHGLAVSLGKIVVSTDQGLIYCFAPDGKGRLLKQKSEFSSGTVLNKFPQKTYGGYLLVLGDDSGMLSNTMAKNSQWMTIVINEDEKIVNKIKKQLAKTGYYGTRVTVFQGNTSKTFLPTHFADLIINAGADVDEKEIKRLLKPHGGQYFADPSIDRPSITQAEPKGEGIWTHQYHDPANTLCSEDRIKGELTTRWFSDFDLNMPNREGRGAPPLYLQGKFYVEGVDALICIDAFTGKEIWRYLSPGIQKHLNQSHYAGSTTGSNLVVSEETLYLVKGNQCLKIDPDTGKEMGKLTLPSPYKKEAWGFIAVKKGLLYGSVADTSFHPMSLWSKSDMSKIHTESKLFFAMNPQTGEVLWTFKPKNSIRHNTIAITEKNVFLIDRVIAEFDKTIEGHHRRDKKKPLPQHPTGTLIALDRKTGKTIWTQKKNIFGTMLAVSEQEGVVVMAYARSGFSYLSDFGGKMVGFDATKGDFLWEVKDMPQDRSRPVLREGQVIVEPFAYHLKSGEKIKGFEIKRKYGCGPITASKNLLIMRSGTMGYIDMTTEDKKIENYGGMRPGCWINFIPAGGMVFIPDTMEGCGCSYLNKSSLALEERTPRPKYTVSGKKITFSKLPQKDVVLRYTTNALPPREESLEVTSSLSLDSGIVLKVKAFSHGKAPSETVIVTQR